MGASLHKQLENPNFHQELLRYYNIKTIKREQLTSEDVIKIVKLPKTSEIELGINTAIISYYLRYESINSTLSNLLNLKVDWLKIYAWLVGCEKKEYFPTLIKKLVVFAEKMTGQTNFNFLKIFDLIVTKYSNQCLILLQFNKIL